MQRQDQLLLDHCLVQTYNLHTDKAFVASLASKAFGTTPPVKAETLKKPTLRRIPNGLNITKEKRRVSIVDLKGSMNDTVDTSNDHSVVALGGSITSKPGTGT